LCAAWVLTVLLSGASADTAALKKEIAELKSAIARTKEKIAQTRKAATQERSSYASYKKQFAARKRSAAGDVDSLKLDYRALRHAADSLARLVRSTRAGQREVQLRTKEFGELLLASCDSLRTVIASFPPGVASAPASALAFLRGELASGSVDPGEALERLWQVHTELAAASHSIEVYSGPAPIASMSGQVDYLRLGFCYLAAVDGEGNAAALWVPSEDSTVGAWRVIEDAAARAALRAAVEVKQGNRVPELAGLPFVHDIVADSLGEQGGER
jgi:hypothetical protein